MKAVADSTVPPSISAGRRRTPLAVAGLVLLGLGGAALVSRLRQLQNEQAERVATTGIRCPQDMRPVPGASFMFGDQMETTISSFCLDVTEVTLAAYRECVRAGACGVPDKAGERCNWHQPNRSRHPVNCVSWQDADQYCTWARKSLPSEAQWEYAARGGFRELEYPWGDAPPSLGNACWSPRGERTGTCPVASFPAAAFGLHDMAGNVSEWVGKRVEPAVRGSRPGHLAHCSRGGSWMVGDPMLLHPVLCIERVDGGPGDNLGFRCAAPATAAAPPR